MLESSFLSGLLAVSLQTPRAYSGDQGAFRLQLEHSEAMLSRALQLANEYVYRVRPKKSEELSATKKMQRRILQCVDFAVEKSGG